jgi:hypothetical protein
VTGKPVRPSEQQAAPELDPTQAARQLGQNVLSKAGRFFGGDKK